MISNLKPYLAYKDSRKAWLGAVPEHWEVLPNRALFIEVKDRERPQEQMLSVTITQGVIKQRELLEGSSKKDSSNQDKSAYKLVQPGDIAYNKMRAWQGAIGESDLKGIVSPAYVVERLREGDSPRYFHHLFRTSAFAKEAERWSYGITSDMWSLRPEHFKRIHTCRPPRSEQSAIVRFLEHAGRRFRGYIAEKRKLMSLLNEQKRAIIHAGITRGVHRSVSLKSSGIEWLGDVPEHWKVQKLRHCSTALGGMTPSMDNRKYWDGDIPWVTPKDMKRSAIGGSEIRVTSLALEETSLRLITPPAVLLVVRGMILARKVPIAWITSPVTVNQDMKALKPKPGIGAEFLATFLDAAQEAFVPLIDEAGHGTRRLPTERWRELQVIVPPRAEQDAIVSGIRSSVEKADAAIERAASEIALVTEFRNRLIADVVLGRFDVRDAAGELPDELGEEPPILPMDGEFEGEPFKASDMAVVSEETET